MPDDREFFPRPTGREFEVARPVGCPKSSCHAYDVHL